MVHYDHTRILPECQRKGLETDQLQRFSFDSPNKRLRIAEWIRIIGGLINDNYFCRPTTTKTAGLSAS